MIRALILGICLLAADTTANSLTAEQFEADYNSLSTEIFINKGEAADIEDFVYEKDVATFTFKKGRILLQRYLNNRPTSAIFVGDAHIHVDVPPVVERRTLCGITGDSAVDLSVRVITIRFSDDFDLKLKEKFAFEDGSLTVSQAKLARNSLGERFFKPDIRHEVDGYFQLLRSAYERADDGYFMAGFDRWYFQFDPNRDEEVRIGFEKFRPSDIAHPVAVFQRKENNACANLQISRIPRDVTMVRDSSIVCAGGMDGYKLLSACNFVDFVVHDDSINSLDFEIYHRNRIDSLTIDGSPLIFKRRRDFDFTGICLPRYYYRDDTISICLKLSKGGLGAAIPRKSGSKSTDYYVSLRFPHGYNYYGLGHSEISRYDDSTDYLTIRTSADRSPIIGCRATGSDTTTNVTSAGIRLNYVDGPTGPARRIKDGTREMLNRAVEFMTDMLPNPPDVEDLYVFHGYNTGSGGTGMVYINNNDPLPDRQGMPIHIGRAASTLWFTPQVQLASYRDNWIKDGVPAFLALMFTRQERGDEVYYRHLVSRKGTISHYYDNFGSVPALSGRVPADVGASQGVWILHMLRCMMQDLQTGSDERFLAFLRELVITANMRPITTADFVELAESHMGGKLDRFFDQFLFGTCLPDYKVAYKITEEAEGHYVDFDVKTDGVGEDFVMPVLVRLDFEEGTSYIRKAVGGREFSFRLGPYSYQPKGAFFNDMLSVLSDYELKKD